MKSNYKKIGDYIRLVDNKNRGLKVSTLLGININKDFMPSIANVSTTDLSKYKVVRKGQFATNIMHVGRDQRLPISLYKNNEPAIVSPAYKVFEVLDENELLSDYLMIEFNRPEFDRLTWFYCDSSVRGGLEWDRFCEIKIPIPDIEIQKKYVNIYNSVLKNQEIYEKSLIDLQLICDEYIENLIISEKPKRLKSYIQQSENLNNDLRINNLLGVSVNKKFFPSKTNMKNLNLSKYKVVLPKEFGYVTVTSRNGEKISIAILDGKAGIISSTYIVFRIKDYELLLPEYLYLFFKRNEFDRYARFNSWGSARETFTWEDMCNVKIPIPDLKVQEAIVTIYNTLETRKRINNKLKETIKPLCPVLMQSVMEEMKGVIEQ